MITLAIAIAVAFGGFSAAYWAADLGIGWSVFLGLVSFGVFQGVFGFFLQRRVKGDMAKVQGILEAGQKRLQQKMQRWQMRPPGSIQAAQKEIADDTRVFVKEALAETENLRRYRLWVPMIERQMATAQLQLNWMIKDFKRVDELMPKAMFLDPTTVAMKLARQQMLGADIAEMENVQGAHRGAEELRRRDIEAQPRVPHEQQGRPLQQLRNRRPVVLPLSRRTKDQGAASALRLPLKMVKKAIVLAAGFGTRLRPFTCATPKPLLPVWGEPMLARMVSRLRALGVDDIVVNSHHLHEQVEAWCAANGCRAAYEPEILGTGGVLNPLREWIAGEPFYLVNGDIVVEGFDGFRESLSPGMIGLCLAAESGPRTIEVEPESGFVTNWKSDDAGFPGTFTYCGFALLSPDILKYVEPGGFSSIVSAYEKAMMDGRFVRAVAPKGLLWTDAGTIASYIDLNSDGEENAFADIPQVKAALEAAKIGGPVEFIGARGSERVFFRGGDSVIVLYDDATRVENGLYAAHARFLGEKGIPVPGVLADLPEIKTLVMENAGVERKVALADAVRVIEALADFNAVDASGLELTAPFDAATWKWERDLFAKHCLGSRFRREMAKDVERELERVAEALEKEPKALVHRDFQSTNILWKNGKPRFIDFQGMRFGPAVYDLASYIYDPYVKPLTERERLALVKAYENRSGRTGLAAVVRLAAVERLVQCLGAYGRLASVGQPQFGKWVLPALQNLLAAADEAGLDAVGALAEDLIAEETRRSHAHKGCSCGHGHEGE